MIKLDEAQAMQLEDRTAFDDEEGYYVAGVEMWHQLHCLVCPHNSSHHFLQVAKIL